MNSRLESRSAKTFGLIAGGTDTTTEMTFDYSPLGEETHRSATTTAPRLDARRAELLRSLRAGGVLDQFTSMHSELVRLEARAAELRNMWETAQKFEDQQNQADLKRQELVTRATLDLAERYLTRMSFELM